ncbi:FadR/GntR family transcriptional regulator [Sphingobacterium sp. Mn56C]|uniref:FadR/GntR family transcriptional regulator n=1 Tax=Sphingobacterium sp. Mn56C TaxID=3395261 RepID=UPI003BD8D97B
MVHRERLSDKIAKQLEHDIQSGVFKEGHKLPTEPELMQRFRVGRSTVREAIKSLSNAKVLRVQQGSGTFVRTSAPARASQDIKAAKFEEINGARRLLEGEIIRKACKTATSLQLHAIEQCLQDKKTAIINNQREQCIQADIRFHLTIAQAANQQVLLAMYQNLTALMTDFFEEREPRGIQFFALNFHLHEKLFQAIKNKNEIQALHILEDILHTNF